MGVDHEKFQFVTLKILPEIGSFIRSFVCHGNWQSIVSNQIRSILFCSNLSMIFPQLHTLILVYFTGEQLFTFVDVIKNFSQLIKLDIRCLGDKHPKELLRKVLATNDGRLRSITFDQDSIDLVLNEAQHDQPVSYPNIEELTVNLVKYEALIRLFMLVPNVSRLHVTCDYSSNLLLEKLKSLSSLIHLKDFQLRSMDNYWTLEQISDILTKMPFLQKLALDLSTKDENLINGHNLVAILPQSLVNLNLFIIYLLLESDIKSDTWHITWPSHIPIACLLSECHRCAIIHTIPCDLCSIVIPAKISKQMLTGWEYMQKVKNLRIYGKASFTEIAMIVQHFHQLQTLNIDLDWDTETST
ncbi:unnamed protein product [Rotaria sp. Silwood2]|nr:unnamed protein product [Rotaria sp. Silwood2]CAF2926684.1 unnamed protein product [Rotaria sp. Silwood2]CAF3258408.1 unnamed protein product [Rotaria sp. Silwood2]CAF3333230.1 unnamed protein product [Rotaria sp. Silwood2]CAF4010113.1 unnamed protein product [Rotaria sp. Silwood2]